MAETKKHRYEREQLKADTSLVTGRMMKYLTEGTRLETLMAETKLRDLMVSMGIMTDKLLLLDGQPTQIIGTPQQKQLDEVGAAVLQALKERGLGGPAVTLTERTVTLEPKG